VTPMKNYLKYLVVIALTIGTFQALAEAGSGGDRGGNGGGTVVCENTVELYDFFEGGHQAIFGFELWPQHQVVSRDEYIKRAMQRFLSSEVDQLLILQVETKLQELLGRGESIFTDSPIRLIKDARIRGIEAPCRYEQVANWQDFGIDRIFIHRALYERMSTMHQAGLYFHEALYATARTNGWKLDSDSIRPLVALLFSYERINGHEFNLVLGKRREIEI